MRMQRGWLWKTVRLQRCRTMCWMGSGQAMRLWGQGRKQDGREGMRLHTLRSSSFKERKKERVKRILRSQSKTIGFLTQLRTCFNVIMYIGEELFSILPELKVVRCRWGLWRSKGGLAEWLMESLRRSKMNGRSSPRRRSVLDGGRVSLSSKLMHTTSSKGNSFQWPQRRREEKEKFSHMRYQRMSGQIGLLKTPPSFRRSWTAEDWRFSALRSRGELRRSWRRQGSKTECCQAGWWEDTSLEMGLDNLARRSQGFASEEIEIRMQHTSLGSLQLSPLRTCRCWFKQRWTRATREWLETWRRRSPRACLWWGHKVPSIASLAMGACPDFIQNR